MLLNKFGRVLPDGSVVKIKLTDILLRIWSINTKYIFVGEKKKTNNYSLAEYPIGSQLLAEYLALV